MICRICDSQRLEPAIDLGQQPWANHFLKPEEAGTEPYYPLRVVFCADCHGAQLDYTVPQQVMFSDHTYLSGTTQTLKRHFEETARTVDALFFGDAKTKSVLDIGSNDGTQLLAYKALGYDVLGVESSANIARLANERGAPTLAEFYNRACAEKIGRRFEIINASGVFFHLEELHSVTDGIRVNLADDGVFVVQFLYMKSIMENGAFDQIYHEHLLYYTIETITHLLNRHGLYPFDAYWSPVHGGSIILMASHKDAYPRSDRLNELVHLENNAGINELAAYHAFADRIRALKDGNLAYLEKARTAGNTVYGFGAPVKGNTLLNYMGIGTHYLTYLVEKNPLRNGLVSPGMHIPIILEEDVTTPPDIYFVLAWNFKKEILHNNRELIEKGVTFHFPINPKETND